MDKLLTPLKYLVFAIFIAAFISVSSSGANQLDSETIFLSLSDITNLKEVCGINLGANISITCSDGVNFIADADGKAVFKKSQKTGSCPQSYLSKEVGYLRPLGVSTAQDKLYLTNPDLHEILVTNKSGEKVYSIGGFESELEYPTDLTFWNKEGKNPALYILDKDQKSISTISESNDIEEIISLPNTESKPSAFTVKEDSFYVIFEDKSQILKTTFKGDYEWFGAEGDNIGQLDLPIDITAGPNNHIYLTDMMNNAIQAYDLDGQLIREFVLYKRMLHGPLALSICNGKIFVIDSKDNLFEFKIRAAQTGVEHFVLGEEHWVLGYYEQSAEEFRKAIRLGYDRAEAHYYLGFSLYNMNDYEKATAQFEKARQKKPSDIQTIFQLANSLYKIGKTEKAVEMYKEVLQYDPNHLEVVLNLGRIYLEMGELKEARSQFRQALELTPDSAEALIGLGRVLLKKGKLTKALNKFTEVSKKGENGRALFYTGLVYYKKKDYEEATQYLEKASSKGPLFVGSLYYLGLSYRFLGKEDRAISYMKEVLELNPDHEGAEKTLEELGQKRTEGE